MKTALLFFILVPSLCLAEGKTQEDRQKVAENLLKDGGLMRATCPDFLQVQLSALGLPAIGEKGAPAGRGGFDRAGIKENPPIMNDSMTIKEGALTISKTLRTHAPSKKTWAVSLKRSLKDGKREIITDSNFKFTVQASDQICRLENLSFVTYEKAQGMKPPVEVSVNECLDLFLKESIEKGSQDPVLKVLAYLKEDCTLLIRYSPETQKMAEKK